jgi:hypothetical protein
MTLAALTREVIDGRCCRVAGQTVGQVSVIHVNDGPGFSTGVTLAAIGRIVIGWSGCAVTGVAFGQPIVIDLDLLEGDGVVAALALVVVETIVGVRMAATTLGDRP